MKKLLGMLVCACLATVMSLGTTGCTKPVKDKDKDKVAADSTKPVTPAKPAGDKEVTVAANPVKAEVKPGKSETVKLTLARGKEAKSDATFDVAVDPKDKGVTAATPAKVLGKDSEGTFKIEVGDEAKAGDYKVTVTGKSDGSKDFMATVTVTVPKKDVAVEKPPVKKEDVKVEVSQPKAVTVKAGEKGTAKVTITLGADLKKGATVKAWIKDKDDKDVKGITVAVDNKTLDKTGDATATVTVADTVAPGDYNLTIETAADGGMPATVTTKVAVKVEKAK